MYTPEGMWFSDPNKQQRPSAPIVISIFDLLDTQFHPDPRRINGCCGVSFRFGQPNLLCPKCRHPIAYFLADGDHTPWAVYLPDVVVEEEEMEAKGEEEIRTLLMLWNGIVRAPDIDLLLPQTAEALEEEWYGTKHLFCPLANDDPESLRLEDIPSLYELELWPYPNGQIAISMDGHLSFLPWPIMENRRHIVLGPSPCGTPREPKWFYIDYHNEYKNPISHAWLKSNLPYGEAIRDEWNSWMLDGEMVVMWSRNNHPSKANRLFRVPYAVWHEAWVSAQQKLHGLQKWYP